jgi:hypothetical protein
VIGNLSQITVRGLDVRTLVCYATRARHTPAASQFGCVWLQSNSVSGIEYRSVWHKLAAGPGLVLKSLRFDQRRVWASRKEPARAFATHP